MIQAVTANKINLVRSVGPYFSIIGPVRKLGMTDTNPDKKVTPENDPDSPDDPIHAEQSS